MQRARRLRITVSVTSSPVSVLAVRLYALSVPSDCDNTNMTDGAIKPIMRPDGKPLDWNDPDTWFCVDSLQDADIYRHLDGYVRCLDCSAVSPERRAHLKAGILQKVNSRHSRSSVRTNTAFYSHWLLAKTKVWH